MAYEEAIRKEFAEELAEMEATGEKLLSKQERQKLDEERKVMEQQEEEQRARVEMERVEEEQRVRAEMERMEEEQRVLLEMGGQGYRKKKRKKGK
ncbi:hypothetical protein H0H92_014221, partial [Tricholoma furcatifolium]